jgi:hypothetical protein
MRSRGITDLMGNRMGFNPGLNVKKNLRILVDNILRLFKNDSNRCRYF